MYSVYDNTGIKGICKDISKCTDDYIPIAGLCGGDKDTQCCVKKKQKSPQ